MYRVISADGHIDFEWLPRDLFVRNAPARLKDRVPQVVETREGVKWIIDGKDLTSFAFGGPAVLEPPPRGVSQHIDRMHDEGFFMDGAHPTTPELRIRDQDIDGVDAEVIYGVSGLGNFLEDQEIIRLVYSTYNDWAAEFRKADPQRFVTLACIPNDDPEAAAAELRRAAKLGLKGADFGVSTAGKPVWHRDWDPLWAAAQDCDMPISFHTTGLPHRLPSDVQMARDYHSQYWATEMVTFQLAGAEYLTGIVFSGALERFPGMRFVLGECGLGWIPYILGRMDQEYDDQFRHLNFSIKPSEYWRRQGYTTFQHEPGLEKVVEAVGEDNILWGSDYPHLDGVWPDSSKFLQGDMACLEERVRQKITCENAGRLYGLIK